MKLSRPLLLLGVLWALLLVPRAIDCQQPAPPPDKKSEAQSLHIRRIVWKPLGELATERFAAVIERVQQEGRCPKVEDLYDPQKVKACENALHEAWKARGVEVGVRSEVTPIGNSHAVQIRFLAYKQ